MTIRAAQVLKYMLGHAYICYLKTEGVKGEVKLRVKKTKKKETPFYREGTLKAAHTV